MNKYLRIIFSDGSIYDIAALIIADHRAKYYVEHDMKEPDNELSAQEIYKEELNNALEDDFEIEDWAKNNMDWKDVEAYAHRVSTKEIDFNEEWSNCECEVIEK